MPTISVEGLLNISEPQASVDLCKERSSLETLSLLEVLSHLEMRLRREILLASKGQTSAGHLKRSLCDKRTKCCGNKTRN